VSESWRSAADYPHPGGTSLGQWAWEFLRRNPRYRADWHAYVNRCESLRAKYGIEAIGDREPTEFAWSCHEDTDATGYDPPKLADATEASSFIDVRGIWSRLEALTCQPLWQRTISMLGNSVNPEGTCMTIWTNVRRQPFKEVFRECGID
jgi:Family of unknown function (DUF6499)